ncbi:hypothetical protein SH449x_002504 [Pirellulaceae bacterium SH449]
MSRHRWTAKWTYLASACLFWTTLGYLLSTTGRAEEPARRFLERLRQEGLSEVGLRYLELGESRNRFSDTFKKDIPLERILLQKESLSTLQRQSPQLVDDRRAELENGLKEFVRSFPDHPRRSEAQSMLADLLLGQGRSLLEQGKKEPAKMAELQTRARKSYSDAVDLFAKTIEELAPKIMELRGDRAKTPEQIEQRRQYQIEYRQAQLLEAKSLQELGETYEPNSAEQRDWLTKAEKKLAELVDKTNLNTEAGTRMLSLLYRGEVQQKLGDKGAARDSFSRVSDIDADGGVLREWKVQATANLVRLDASENPPKFEAAIKRGTDALELVKNRNNPERRLPHWIDLQLALSEAQIGFAKTLDKSREDAKIKGLNREARQSLQEILKVKGLHQEPAKALLVELGIESSDDVVAEKLPEPKDFEEALSQGRMRVSRAEDGKQAVEILKQQGASEEDIQNAVGQIQQARLQAIERLTKAIGLFKDTNSREDLLDAKFLLTYLYFNTEQYWESAALSESIIRTDKGTEKAAQSGMFALASMSKLIDSFGPEEQASMMMPMERLAKSLIANFPESDTGKQAADILVKVAIMNKKYDEAERFVGLTGGKGGSGASVLGQILWRDFLVQSEELRKQGEQATPEIVSLRDRAERLLASTWSTLDPSKVDRSLLMGVSSLANLYLSSDRLADAERVISDPDRGAMKLLETATGLDETAQLEVFKLQLQAMVQSASQPDGSALDAARVQELVGRMKTLAGADTKLLTNSLRNLAYSIQTQIESAATPVDQSRIGKSLSILVSQLVNVSEDIGVLDSAGSVASSLAMTMKKTPSLSLLSSELFVVADAAFSKIASQSDEALVASGRNKDDIRRRMAIAKSGAGKHEEAHKLLLESLQASATNITLQMLAAENLQKWSANKDVELLRKASEGAEPGADGKNVIWGWGVIAARISRDPNGMTRLRDSFFEAKFNNIECKRLMASLTTDAARKAEIVRDAANELRVLKVRNPDFGSPEFQSKFQRLESELNAMSR